MTFDLMTTEIHTNLAKYADWIRADDAHAVHHLRLVDQVDDVLSKRIELPADDRAVLVQRLERWRYLWLAERSGRVTENDLGLVDAIDLAANRLAGRATRPPRGPRSAIQNDNPKDGLDELKKWLDPETPLDELIDQASRTTQSRFGGNDPAAGRPMLLYAPLYLSSFCINQCTYCGFRFDQSIERKHLSIDEAIDEAEILRQRGFRHVLLVAGDFPRLDRGEYFAEIISRLCEKGICPAVEIAPQSTQAYAELVAAGLCGVTLYQETYDETRYSDYHPGGTKASFDWRLEGPERAAEAGVGRLGLGVLLGLSDPREDVLAMARHGVYLQERFPDVRLAFSLPRISEAPADFSLPHVVDDELFVRLYCALRMAFPGANLVLSTRESPELRERMAKICITQLSAGSCTAPGGYGHEPTDGQFPVHDNRGVAEVVERLERDGIYPVWDFDELDGVDSRQ